MECVLRDEFGILMFLLGMVLICILPLRLMVSCLPDSNAIRHEQFKLCIEAGMEWKNGNCMSKKP